jgi:hypothetical protein
MREGKRKKNLQQARVMCNKRPRLVGNSAEDKIEN